MGFDTGGSGGGAPTDAEYVTGSSDPDLTNEVVRSPGSDILLAGSFGSTASISPGFGTWTTLDPDNPGWLIYRLRAVTDGSTSGQIEIDVDESGGTTADYTPVVCFTDNTHNSGTLLVEAGLVYVPAGASFIIRNVNDPNGNNSIQASRELIITP